MVTQNFFGQIWQTVEEILAQKHHIWLSVTEAESRGKLVDRVTGAGQSVALVVQSRQNLDRNAD